MNNLIKINLLPYREEMNKRKQQQFKTLMYGAVLTGVAAVAATYLFIDNMINNQSERNTLLETSIAHLDTELSEIQKLKQEKDAFLIKKNKIEELQLKRLQAAKILDSLNEAVPGSTYLTSLDAVTADSYRLSGRTSSDNRVAAMMRAMPNTGIFKQPELLSIKKNNSHQEFTLQATLQPIVKAAESKENPASGNAQEAN
ncbi:TPA: PilN domain-containing protein [Neisseria meningitidis]|jgi:Tfp pilus assembly protein PilN|uniref:PilN protein n=9 Tax=Neisseria meningitidis TaxID=487 RepID=Q4W563_NEIMB|nr:MULTISPECIES: PilN domain-containing protein [Neisseria]AJC62971.1 pilus assembly protein PilP [Neisseria meningitidis LNP21362]EGC52373.1 type IV pilus assembly protein PilN [Neisseria meningitidis OX99.30304]EOB84466.1 fimbrial assembly family protein [Neisseria meningitidis NM604]EOC10237.1 fimbrial assembly family protein [Neisseria meningitidis 73696]KER39077.1 fimbrial assembly family protein [Neisseria meningitidis 992008]CBA04806.1 fimbrial assembly membrane protein [Neisseria meni